MTTSAPARIGPVRWLIAEATTALFGPDHHGVSDNWIQELREAGQPDTGRHYRHNIRPVPADHLLSPAAYQYATRTTDQVHADVDQATGLHDLTDIHNALAGSNR